MSPHAPARTALASLAGAALLVATVAATWAVSSVSDLVVRFTPAPALASYGWALPVAIGIVVFAWWFATWRPDEVAGDAGAARRRAALGAAFFCACGTVLLGLLLVTWGPGWFTERLGDLHTEPASVHAKAEPRVDGLRRNTCAAYAVQLRPAGSDAFVTWCGGRDAWARLVPGQVVLLSWRTSVFGTVGLTVDTEAGGGATPGP